MKYFKVSLSLVVVVFLSNCTHLEGLVNYLDEWAEEKREKIYETYLNKELVNWYKSVFLERFDALPGFPLFIKTTLIQEDFLGGSIQYPSSIVMTSPDDDKRELQEAIDEYDFFQEDTLSWYKDYAKDIDAQIEVHDFELTKTIFAKTDIDIVKSMEGELKLTRCVYGDTYLTLLGDEVDSAFVNIICSYVGPHPYLVDRKNKNIRKGYAVAIGYFGVIDSDLLPSF